MANGQGQRLAPSAYYSKVLRTIQNVGAVESGEFNFGAYVTEVRRVINKNKYIISKALLMPNQVSPMLYRLLKVHEANMPMWPLVS